MIWLALLASYVSNAQEIVKTPGGEMIGLMPPTDASSLQLLNEAISIAAPDYIYSVQMMFDEPVRLEEIREVARYLSILRVIAFVEYGPRSDLRARPSVLIGLGTLYDDEESWRHEICRAKLFVAASRDNELLDGPPEHWTVNEIHVYGSVHAVRELRAGILLPRARVTEGWAQDKRHLQGFVSYTRQDLAKKVEIPDNRAVPEKCRKFSQRIESPILTGKTTIQGLVGANTRAADFRPQLHQHLAERAPETPVTLRIVLNFDATLELFASLVSQYDIDGLLAELTPGDSSIRLEMLVELSTHGASLENQVRRARCQMRLGHGAQVSGEWYARSARVSVPVSKVWQLLSYSELQNARLLADFETGALAAVEAYHRRKATEVLRIPRSIALPSGCEQFIQHTP